MWSSTNTFSCCDPAPPPEEKQSSPIPYAGVLKMEIRQLMWLKNLSLLIPLSFQTDWVPNAAHHKAKHMAEQSPEYKKREMELLSSAAVSTNCNYNPGEKRKTFYVAYTSSFFFLLNPMTSPKEKLGWS